MTKRQKDKVTIMTKRQKTKTKKRVSYCDVCETALILIKSAKLPSLAMFLTKFKTVNLLDLLYSFIK